MRSRGLLFQVGLCALVACGSCGKSKVDGDKESLVAAPGVTSVPSALPSSPVEAPAAKAPPHQVRSLPDGGGWEVSHRWTARTPQGPRGADVRAVLDAGAVSSERAGFGIPRAEQDVAYTDDAELKRIMAARNDRFLSRGIEQRVEGDELQLRVAYASVVGASSTRLVSLRRALDKGADAFGIQGVRGRLDWYASFVQSFSWDEPPRYGSGPNGEELLTCGARPPLATVLKGAGDCDSLSMLFSGLAMGLPETEQVFLAGQVGSEPHLLVGVRLPIETGDLYVDYDDKRFVLFELTSRAIDQPISERARKLLEGAEFEVIPL